MKTLQCDGYTYQYELRKVELQIIVIFYEPPTPCISITNCIQDLLRKALEKDAELSKNAASIKRIYQHSPQGKGINCEWQSGAVEINEISTEISLFDKLKSVFGFKEKQSRRWEISEPHWASCSQPTISKI